MKEIFVKNTQLMIGLLVLSFSFIHAMDELEDVIVTVSYDFPTYTPDFDLVCNIKDIDREDPKSCITAFFIHKQATNLVRCLDAKIKSDEAILKPLFESGKNINGFDFKLAGRILYKPGTSQLTGKSKWIAQCDITRNQHADGNVIDAKINEFYQNLKKHGVEDVRIRVCYDYSK